MNIFGFTPAIVKLTKNVDCNKYIITNEIIKDKYIMNFFNAIFLSIFFYSFVTTSTVSSLSKSTAVSIIAYESVLFVPFSTFFIFPTCIPFI